MSDFDFDALRDPEPPPPDSGRRAAVDARARSLRAQSRFNRLAMSSVSVVVVLAVVAGIVAAQRDDDGPGLIVEGPTTTEPSSIGDRFVPPTTIDDGIVTLPVTLPDGETTTLRYPQGLGIAQLGFAGSIGVHGSGSGTGGRPLSVTYQTIAAAYGDAEPVRQYRGANGEEVPYFHGSRRNPPAATALDYLVFQFGPWLVQLFNEPPGGARLTDEQLATWARSLTGSLDDNGWLVLHAAAPLAIGNTFEGGFGAATADANQLELASHRYCGQARAGGDSAVHRRFTNEDGTYGVAWCVGDDLHVAATGTQRFADRVDTDLQVTGLTGAPDEPAVTPTTTTTTTSAPTASPGHAVSASFVSPDHGWVLEDDGTVAETDDAGRTWRDVGTSTAPSGGKIRFADSRYGYRLDSAGIHTTDDGGARWAPMHTPFGPHVFDLAAANGVVYVATYDAAFPGDVYVWTTPVGGTTWTRHDTGVSTGGGPAPSTQLVFSGDRGWLLQVNRTVVGGAQLTTTGDWLAWTPPCADAMGPAYLTASTANDLVATCNEGAWGSPPPQATTVSFSRDGGQNFTRRAAPAYGPVLSPTADTAVVVGDQTLRRTTDTGATWGTVARTPNRAADDWGFTTSTQGFVITNGEVLMTYDAGATWQPVTLP